MGREKIKVVHITQGFGGLFTYIKNIVEKIDREKFQLEIIAPNNEECKKFCDYYGIKYTIVDMQRGFNPFKDLISLFQLYQYLIRNKPNITHVHSAKAGFLGRIASYITGSPSIYTPHGISYLGFTGFKRTLFFSLEVFAKKFTNHLLACSESEKLRCVYEVGVPESKIKVLNNSIEVNQMPPLIREHKGTLHIGIVARLTYAKNPVLFVQIANEIKKKYSFAKFSILGAGFTDDLKPQFLQAISQFGLEEAFTIHDWGSYNKIEEYLATLDIFLMPSIFEGLPFALLEAINENILCITSKCDGCCVVINNKENGYSCMVLDDYVKAIIHAIENPQFNYELRLKAKQDLSKKFNLDIFIKKLENYYLEIQNNK